MIFLGVVGLLFIFFAPQIIWFYTDDPNVAHYGVDCLRIVAYGFLFYAYGMVLGQSFNGAGDTWTPTIINLFVFWLWEIPLAYVLSVVLGWGPRGVFISMTIAFSTLAVVSACSVSAGPLEAASSLSSATDSFIEHSCRASLRFHAISAPHLRHSAPNRLGGTCVA